MRHLCEIGFHIMGQRIHTGGGGHGCREVHGQQGIGENDAGQQFGGEKDPLAVCFIISDDGTSSHFTSGAGRGGDGHKMRHVARDINIPADEVVVFKEILPMMHAQYDRPGHVHGRTASDAHHTVAIFLVKGLCSLVHIRLDGIFVHVMEHGRMQPAGIQSRHHLFEEGKSRHYRVRHHQRPGKALF